MAERTWMNKIPEQMSSACCKVYALHSSCFSRDIHRTETKKTKQLMGQLSWTLSPQEQRNVPKFGQIILRGTNLRLDDSYLSDLPFCNSEAGLSWIGYPEMKKMVKVMRNETLSVDPCIHCVITWQNKRLSHGHFDVSSFIKYDIMITDFWRILIVDAGDDG